MLKKITILSFWLISILSAIIFSHENPEAIKSIKNYFKNYFKSYQKVEVPTDIILKKEDIEANAFNISFKLIALFENGFKTAFVSYDDTNDYFNKKKLKIYYQSGGIFDNSNYKDPIFKFLTTDYSGGVKTIFTHKNNKFAFMSSLKDDCMYASIVSLQTNNEIFNTKCLPVENKKQNTEWIDFNGLGSTNIHYKNKILLSIGAPEAYNSEIANLAQDKKSFFGKIIEIDKDDLDLVISKKKEKINAKIFSLGHRNPQGLTKINEHVFSVEHGPKGGDELNKIFLNKNYGWPESSYGIRYLDDDNKKFYNRNHEDYGFEEPLFALVPSVGISSLNNCPKNLSSYYKRPCLMALSLSGNDLRAGNSIIIYLLNNKMTKVQSIEKIFLLNKGRLRHFVTNSKNELYEDQNGDIYISVDSIGIHRLSFLGL
jgi:hypothetical protein